MHKKDTNTSPFHISYRLS